MTQIKKDDGKKIIEFLESTLKVDIPRDGFLAGQSVCSALLYLHKKHKDFFVNDLDIFLSNSVLSLKEIKSFSNKQSKMLHSMVGFNNQNFFQSNFKFSNREVINGLNINKELQKKLSNKENKDLPEGDYSRDLVSGLVYKIKEKNTFFNKKEVSFSASTTRGVFDTTRKGIFNYIYFEDSYYDTSDYLKVLMDFDINCTQIGICLRTNRIIFTKDFLNFYNTMHLSICKPDTPYHSIIRLFKKQKEFNFNYSLELESFYIANLLRFGIFSKKNKYRNRRNKFSGYCFGDIYANKYKESNDIDKYFNLYELKKQGKEIKDYRNNAKDKFYDYKLYKLRSSVDSFNYIESGEHKKKLQDNLGASIKGYEDYIHVNLKNIIKQNIEDNKKVYSYSTKDIDFANQYKDIHKIKNSSEISKEENKINKQYEIFNYYHSKGENIKNEVINEIVDILVESTYFSKFLYLTDNLDDMLNVFKHVREKFNSDNIVRGAIINKKFNKHKYDYKNLMASINRTINNAKSKYSHEVLSNFHYDFKCPKGYNFEIINTEYLLKEQALYQKFVLSPYKLGIKNNKYVVVSFYNTKKDRKTFIFNIENNKLILNSYKLYTYSNVGMKNKKENRLFLENVLKLNDIETI